MSHSDFQMQNRNDQVQTERSKFNNCLHELQCFLANKKIEVKNNNISTEKIDDS